MQNYTCLFDDLYTLDTRYGNKKQLLANLELIFNPKNIESLK